MDPNLPDSSKPTNVRAIFIVILALGILAAAVTYAINRGRNEATQDNTTNNQTQSNFKPVAPQTFVYGTWSGQSAFIKSFDLQTGEQQVLAQLPDKIKKITVLDKDQFLYIYNTDDRDHGNALAVYSIADQTPGSVYTADSGFGIDDYVVSPNKKYVAVWEVSFKPGQAGLAGGTSRVYTADISNPSSQKHLIYDETQTGDTPVHYPRAITNTGQVFSDRFLPNSLHGWGYGMSVSNFDGTTKQDIPDMQNGSYGSQPNVSPDGQYLAFAGFTSSRGAADQTDRADALAGANTIAVYDLQTNTRKTLPNLPSTNSYLDVRWDSTGNIIYWALADANHASNTGMYSYDLTTQKPTRINLPNLDTDYAIGNLANGKVLYGSDNTGGTALGNLGDNYSQPFTNLYVLDSTGKKQELKLPDNLIQYITMTSSNYFTEDTGNNGQTSVQAAGNNGKKNNAKKNNGNNSGSNNGQNSDQANSGQYGSDCTGFDNLQLCPFYFKAQLEPQREAQQTIPACYDGLIGPECQKQGYQKDSDGYKQCLRDNVRPYRHAGMCVGSPLYLYGPEGDQVQVHINTGVHAAVPSYNNGYAVTLLTGGKMEVNGGTFDKLSYDYDSGTTRITPPAQGVVTDKNGVSKVIADYAANLGLNAKETADLQDYATQQVISPYVYISFFDQATSEKILPISFSPTPDNYRNIVFYFRLLSQKPPFDVLPPIYPAKIQRNGLTAVEVSGIVE